MNFHILTLFPELFAPYMNVGIIGRACEKGILSYHTHFLRDYTQDVHRTVDDRPYGGGSGMVLKADILAIAIRDIRQKYAIDRVILLSPRGRLLGDSVAREYSQYKSLLLISGRYEGVDQRAIDLLVDEELSIGDYVLSGGELPALVTMDVISRFVPGVVGKEEGPQKESHVNGLLEHPHYTRPAVFEGLAVPDILLSGHHDSIEKWRQQKSEEVTRQMRPDLWAKKK